MAEETKHAGILIDDVQVTDMSRVKERATYVPKGGKVTRVAGQNIVTVELPKDQAVQNFEPGRIHDGGGVKYSDVTRTMPGKKNSRFRINELTRGPLSVEAEEEARIEAEIQSRLNARLEEMRVSVEKTAYDVGFTAGREDARQEVLTALQPKMTSFDQMVQKFESMRLEIYKANEEFLLNLVNQLTKAVVLRELKGDPDYTRRLATLLLDKLGTRENIKIYIGKEELAAAEQLKAGLAQKLGELKNISIEADHDNDGGCRIETEFGEVDARIGVQIESIARALGAGNN